MTEQAQTTGSPSIISKFHGGDAARPAADIFGASLPADIHDPAAARNTLIAQLKQNRSRALFKLQQSGVSDEIITRQRTAWNERLNQQIKMVQDLSDENAVMIRRGNYERYGDAAHEAQKLWNGIQAPQPVTRSVAPSAAMMRK